MQELVPTEKTTILANSDASIDAAFIATWLHGKAEKTQRAYSTDAERFFTFVGKELRTVTLADFQDYIDSLADLKPATQARMIASVKSMLSFACKTGYLQFNVGAVVKLPKIENTLAERIMSEEQVVKMFALESNKRNHAMLVLLYRAGLRASEICNLQWRHLTPRDEQGTGQLAIFGKGKKTRFILLDKKTWQELMVLKTPALLAKLAHADEYVFCSRKRTHESTRLDESQVHRIVKSAAARAGVAAYELEDKKASSKASPHWMRHAHATHSLERGAPITLVRDTLGHASMETTAKYTHVRPNASSGQFLGV